MFKRNSIVAAILCLAATTAAFGQPGTGYVFQIPGASTTSINNQIVGYQDVGTIAPAINALGPNGTFQIQAKPDGTGFYILGSTLQIANATFTSFNTVNGIPTPQDKQPLTLSTSPDGNYAVIGDGSAYILSASSYSILQTVATGGTVMGTAISRDSKYAYILTDTIINTTVTKVSLPSGAAIGSPLVLPTIASQIAISPLGLLYVGGPNNIFEINPTTMAITSNGTIQFVATPGPLHFTPDGTTLYFANLTAVYTGGSILQITLATTATNVATVAKWPNLVGGSPTPIDDVLIAGNSRIFAISYANQTLYDVNPSPLGLQVSSLNSIFNAQAVLGVAISNEIPAAHLFAFVASSPQNVLYRVNLSNNSAPTPTGATAQTGTLEYVGIPSQSAPASFLQYNVSQTVAQGATSLPLIARVLDLNNKPVFNFPVSFTAPSGFTVNTATPTTNADGYVQTTVVAPSVSGTFTITLTAGTASASYTITVPGAPGSGGTGPSGVQQVTIVSGNGQLIPQGQSTLVTGNSLTILVTDVNGVPLPGVATTFSVTSGTGFIINPSGLTDANGHASADFFASLPAGGLDFEADTVQATTAYGLVAFTETEFAIFANTGNGSGEAFPPHVIQVPPYNTNVTVPEGGVTPNAFAAQINAQWFPQYGNPIPNVSIFIIDTTQGSPYPLSTHAACAATSLPSDTATGIAHCDVVALCGTGGSSALGTWPVAFSVGGFAYYSGTVTVTQGAGSSLSIVSGNNQTGPAGQALQYPLTAVVTDGCNNPIAGTAVTWAVKTGSATLTNVVSTSTSAGRVSAGVKFGITPGTVVVTCTLGTTVIATFTLTSSPVVSGLSIVNGNNQSVTVSSAFPLPLTVQLNDTNNNPISGATITFTATSGNISINPTTATTNAQGQASTTATASQTPGSATVTATYAGVSAVFTETAIPQGPLVSVANFQNAASFQTGLVPCGLATATGSGIAPGITGTVSGASFFGPLQTTLNGFSLSVNGIPAPIYQLSNTNGKQQVTFQTPCEAPVTNNGTVTLSLNGGTSTITGVSILAAQPGIFYATGSNGIAYGDVISGADGSYVSASNPAKRGGTYYLIATGLGQVTPTTATNSVGINGQSVANQVIVGVSNLGVPVTTAYYQPGEVGVYVVGFTIPLLNPAGTNQPLVVGLVENGQTLFSNTVYIPVVQ